MVKQYTESQYDDDLTLSNDVYDESYYSDADDLFEFSTDDESPISRLKSLVLSIDWEITDEVLLQFNEELLDLRGIWAGESINLVYIQALEKISKYIYQNKADSHPNAIKLLLTFYYNLEKIVSSQDLSEGQKKDILMEDVRKFENLKRQIKHKPFSVSSREPERPQSQPRKMTTEASGEDQLLNLKAIVLGIDWEITDQDLTDLRREVFRLEDKFSKSRPKLILLQGIGTLAAYIKVKKSNAHPDAFKVMQLFYESLERIVQEPMTLEAEKVILFPAVEKFNSFKALLGPTISPESMIKKDDETVERFGSASDASTISPALADVSEEEAVGFQAEKEAMALGLKDSGGVATHIDNFFGGSFSTQSFAEEAAKEQEKIEAGTVISTFTEDEGVTVEKDLALQGIDVGSDDEDEFDHEENVTARDIVAPFGFKEMPTAADEEILGSVAESPLIAKAAQREEEQEDLVLPEEEIVGTIETIFPVGSKDFLPLEQENAALDRENALKGVDVETEADDDTDELSLPMEGEELAPALAAMDEESLFSATTLDQAPMVSSVTEEIVDTIDGLFLDHDELPAVPGFDKPAEEPVADSIHVEVENEELIVFEDWLKEDSKDEGSVETTIGSEAAPADDKKSFDSDVQELELVETEGKAENEFPAMDIVENQEEDNLSSFFTDNDFEQSTKAGADIDALFDSLEVDLDGDARENAPAEMSENLEAFFGSEQGPEEPAAEAVPGVYPEMREEDVVETSVNALFVETQSVDDEVVFELFQEEVAPRVAISQENEIEGELPILETSIVPDECHTTEFVAATGNEIVEGLADGSAVGASEQKMLSPLSELQSCIDSLKIEVNDAIIAGLFKEINALRQKWADQPLEKTFLQLLSTVTQHIDIYRYESSAEAYRLLVSVCQAISSLKDETPQVCQEMLLDETCKVLEWQQGMLSRQAVKKGSQLTFADPLRTEKEGTYRSDAQKDFDDLLETYEEGGADEHALKKESVVEGETEPMQQAFAADLKKEIAALRQTLQMEIADLRRELIKD